MNDLIEQPKDQPVPSDVILTQIVHDFIDQRILPTAQNKMLHQRVLQWRMKVDIQEIVTRIEMLRFESDELRRQWEDLVAAEAQQAAKSGNHPVGVACAKNSNGETVYWHEWADIDGTEADIINFEKSPFELPPPSPNLTDEQAARLARKIAAETRGLPDDPQINIASNFDAVFSPLDLGEWDYVVSRSSGKYNYLLRIINAVCKQHISRMANESRDSSGFNIKAVYLQDSLKQSRVFSTMDKTNVAWSWALAGAGRVFAVDGASLLLPSYVAILPENADKFPQQQSFLPDNTRIPQNNVDPTTALYLDQQSVVGVSPEELMGKMADCVISPTASKIAILILACHSTMEQTATLGELAKIAMGSARADELRRVSDALRELDKLCIYYPDKTRSRAFQMRLPANPNELHPDQIVGGALSASLVSVSSAWATKHKNYKGSVLFDISGVISMPNRNSTALRLYMRCAAAWNQLATSSGGETVDIDGVPWLDGEVWGRIGNALPESAIRYLQANTNTGSDVNVRDTVRRVAEQLDYLHMMGMITLDVKKFGKRLRYRALPPPVYIAARQQYVEHKWRHATIEAEMIRGVTQPLPPRLTRKSGKLTSRTVSEPHAKP